MRFTRVEAGSCSLCNQPRTEQRPLVGVAHRRFRICHDCVEVSLDIIREDQLCRLERREERPDTPIDPEAMVNELIARGVDPVTVATVREGFRLAALPPDQLLAELAAAPPRADYACSVCDAPRRQVFKLICGPKCFVCDRCVVAAAAALA